ncbi:hemolysin family protein [Pontibacter cellulosilyticus]|uniref:HlyC/CorC family transporter n=1 Tax=Pontibacter cellulosilyticus TaxID=1720253 RepID=A0A923N5Y9_9BACT|nr:hemolysin family protein [Pontibacter cellulosilyticus]MBC5992841.1 HlyC/CorC family transporter [Pontibacter cellulosilyticus]
MEFVIILILTLFNGYFAMSETALVSVRKSRVEHKAEKGNARARVILQLQKNPENFLSSIQLGITLIGIVAGAYGGTTLAGKVAPYIGRVDALAPYAFEVAITLLVIFITYFTIVVGELIPKTLALRNTLAVALFVAPSIRFFTSVTYPLVRLLSGTTNFLIKIFRINPKNPSQTVTEEELRHMLRVAGREGVLEHEEEQIHQNIFSLYDQRNSSLMTPRASVLWIEAHTPLKAIHEAILQSNHSKFPVCEGTIDQIIGILSAKDFLAHMHNPGFDLNTILKAPVFVSDSMLAVNTLRLFRQEKQYLGIVVDEHSTVEGIITLHDIMEAIVGDIPDIGEEAEPAIYVREDGSILISGITTVARLNDYLGYKFIPEDSKLYTTLAGFMLHQLAQVPHIGDKLQNDGYLLEVIDMDGSRIDKILLSKTA